MKLGVSSYSLYKAMDKKEMNIFEVMDWVKEIGGSHFEVVPLGFDLTEKQELADDIRSHALKLGLELSNYAIGASFVDLTEEALENEIERVKLHVRIADRLGIRLMRHDIAPRAKEEADIARYYDDLPILVNACREIADYASQYGITTSIENHGYHVQESDRVKLLVHLVDRDNFKTTLDVGNFLCADENPLTAVANNIGIASMVHLKDFYYRPEGQNPGEGWFGTKYGNHLRGAITGQGDLDMYGILRIIKNFGYKGYISIEFEGVEDCIYGTKAGFDNARRIWNEV
ncbi:MAG TPA: sugar phosphate isomerase/epimerase family protein [Bacillaceae bacterium]